MYFLFFPFYQFTVLSSRTVDGRQMYFRGSVVGKASTIDIEISPTPPLIFTGGQKVKKRSKISEREFENRLRFNEIIVTREWRVFWGHSVYYKLVTSKNCKADFGICADCTLKIGSAG